MGNVVVGKFSVDENFDASDAAEFSDVFEIKFRK